MHKLNIYFSPIYIICAFITIYLGGLSTFCYYFVALCLHEYSHYFVAKRLGYMINNLSFLPYGAKLQGNTNYKKKSHELIVALSGPLCNLIVALLIISLWWLKPITYPYTYQFVEANFYIGFFNLMPLFPLDGGQVFLNVFNGEKIKKIAYKIMQIIGVIISVLFLSLFIVSSLNKINFSLFFISLFLFVVSIAPYNVNYLTKIDSLDFKLNNYTECKIFVVSSNINFLKLLKIINANYYYYFYFVDTKLNIIKILGEREILNFVNKGVYYISTKN